MLLLIMITLMCCGGEVFSSSIFSQCKKNDIPCIENTVNTALPILFDGIPELEIPKSDPQFVDVINANLSILTYTFFNSTLYGYKNCKMSNLKINDELTKVNCEMLCTSLMMNGQYEINGRLITLPIEGKGDYDFNAASFHVDLGVSLNKIKGSEGKTHFFIKKITFKAKPLNPVKFNFQNLFNGQKDLAATVKKFARENWLEITMLVQDPIWEASLNQLKSVMNKYLKTFAIEDTILN
ncbi:circadian clock-controlled protein daywake-like [Nymphalis io]|uniref:circadian clock-controlled protein daywake-like n=1 Tax=Inachis io TaxID=171585 RepID=UPI00216A7019|nr:circadian clock-controlled protein daywake-like [Nymphalis io]